METNTAASAAELALWRSLMLRAFRRGVPRPEAEDLASQALLKALQAHVPERGDFAPFCVAIHANLLRNWWRDRKPTEPWDEQMHDLSGPDDPHADLADQEERAMFQHIADRILSVLEPDEAALFLAMGDLARDAERAAVSAAARRVGLAPLKAWDVFRRIQRKARAFTGDFAVVSSCRPLPLVMDELRGDIERVTVREPQPRPQDEPEEPPAVAEEMPLRWAAHARPGLFPSLFRIAAHADAGFSAFAAGLTPEQRGRLAALLPEPVTPD